MDQPNLGSSSTEAFLSWLQVKLTTKANQDSGRGVPRFTLEASQCGFLTPATVQLLSSAGLETHFTDEESGSWSHVLGKFESY